MNKNTLLNISLLSIVVILLIFFSLDSTSAKLDHYDIKSVRGTVCSVKEYNGQTALIIKKMMLTSRNGCVYILKGKTRLYFRIENASIYPGDILVCKMKSQGGIFFDKYEIIRRSPLARLYRIRYLSLKAIFSILKKMNPLNASLYKALFWNNRESIPERVQMFFEKTGCIHFLALSGFHAGLIISLLGFIIHIVVPKDRILIFIIPILVIYLAITGFPSSLFRTVFIIFLIWFNGTVCYSRSFIKIISLALIVQLLIFREISMGFQFSYAAYGGLSVLSPFLIRAINRILPARGAQTLGITMGAQSGVTPILKYNTGRINSLTPVYSIILSPVMTIYMYSILLIHIFNTVLPRNPVLKNIDNILAWGLAFLIDVVERITIPPFFRIQSWKGCLIYLIILLIPVLIQSGVWVGLFWKIRYRRYRLQLPESYRGSHLFPELDDTAALRSKLPD